VLLHPLVEVAVLETARGGILREGLAFDWCSVGVVTNISADHLGMGGVENLEQLAAVKQVVIESVARDGAAVLNAEDPLVAEMAAATDARIVYFSLNPQNHIIQAHLAEDNGWCVFIENGMIVLAKGPERVELIELERLPFTAAGKIRFQVQNALAATAAAWAAGLNPAMIGRALTTFKSDIKMSPGRFNRLEFNGVEVIFDYGHNQAALKALAEAITALEPRKTIHVIGLPGDRRDDDLKTTIMPTLAYTDEYFLHDLKDRRGRDKDEVPRLLQSVIKDVRPSQILPGQHEAIMKAWQQLKPGDRLVITADIVEDSIKTLEMLTDNLDEEGACSISPDSDEATPPDSATVALQNWAAPASNPDWNMGDR
jgi:cyanophycin synthetase